MYNDRSLQTPFICTTKQENKTVRVPVLFRLGRAKPTLSLVRWKRSDSPPQHLQAGGNAAPRRHVVHAPRDERPQLLRHLWFLQKRHEVSCSQGCQLRANRTDTGSAAATSTVPPAATGSLAPTRLFRATVNIRAP